jgi:hypothetical protein
LFSAPESGCVKNLAGCPGMKRDAHAIGSRNGHNVFGCARRARRILRRGSIFFDFEFDFLMSMKYGLAVAQKERDQMPFRLAPDQMRRLDRAARERGQSRQAFVEGCVLAELSEHEERRHAKRNAHGLRGDAKKEERASSTERVGLGIGDTLRRRLEITEEEEHPAAAQAPVIVNVGSGAGGASATGDIDRRDIRRERRREGARDAAAHRGRSLGRVGCN